MSIAEFAVQLIPSGDTVVGLGSGHAARMFLDALAQRLQGGELRIRGGIPTSVETECYARRLGIPLLTPEQCDTIDITVDGADEVDLQLNLIKGYGRSLVREKIIAEASNSYIILVGPEKLVSRLGERGILPVEIVPFAFHFCQKRLRELGLTPVLYQKDNKAFQSDNGNFILDCALPDFIDAGELERNVLAIPGVVGTGFFLNQADTVFIGVGDTMEFQEQRHRTGKDIP